MNTLFQALAEAGHALRRWLGEVVRSNPTQRDRALHTNLRRLIIICAVGFPVSLVHVVVFWLYAPAGGPDEVIWRQAIIATHVLLAVLELAFLVVSYRLLRGAPPRWLLIGAQYLAMALIALAGAAITGIDQLVTANMTPFLVASILIALVFLVPPQVSLPIYAAAFVLLYAAVGYTQGEAAIALSNRLNGLTSVGLGFSLSVMLWSSFLRRAEQQARIEEQQRRLEALATVDPLTGLLNRRRFEETVATEVARLERVDVESCLVLMDMDQFKAVNDEFGHPAGDQVLRAVAAILNQNVRRYDVLARWGGEEFIMLFPDTSSRAGLEIAEKLRRAIEQTAFYAAGYTLRLTASFGLVALRSAGEDVFERTYARADAALYRAKHAGRNRVETDDSTQ